RCHRGAQSRTRPSLEASGPRRFDVIQAASYHRRPGLYLLGRGFMIPRRFVIAGLGILLAVVLAVVLRPNGSNDSAKTSEPAANVDPGESAEPGEFEGEEAEGRGGAAEAQEEAEVTEKRL